MLDLLERQTNEAEDHREIVATATVGDISLEAVQLGQRPPSCAGAVAQDGDDRVAFFLAPGQWPRVFPGL
jgi:hypothetical protein